MQSDDLAQIVNVVNLYAFAVDSHQYEIFKEVFTEDIRCDFGGGAAFSDRETLMRVFKDIHAAFSANQHIVSGHTTRLAGDTAHCFSYVNAFFRRTIDAKECLFNSTGWYEDKLIRTPQGWRIKDRLSRMVSVSGDHRVMQAMPGIDTEFKLASLAEEASAGQLKFSPAGPAR